MTRCLFLGAATLLTFFWACASLAAGKQESATSMKAACDALRLLISKQLHASRGLDEYRCDDTQPGPPGFYVFALRSNYPAPEGAPPNWVGSALIGWYAVRKTDGQVRDWDLGNEKLGNVIQ